MRRLTQKVRHAPQAHIFTSMNMTSLIDLFTILILFLLFHLAGAGEILPVSEKLKLPLSISDTPLEPTVNVVVTTEEISIGEKRVANVKEVLQSPDLLIQGLKDELDRHAQKAKEIGKATGTLIFKGDVTIIGDRLIPFKLLEKVMYTCSQAEFSNIRLAVVQKEE